MSLRKQLAAAMLAEALKRPYCSAEIEERIIDVGGPLDPQNALQLAKQREYFEAYETRAEEIAKAYAEVTDETDIETLPTAVRILHEAIGTDGDDARAYKLIAELDEPEADAVIYAIAKAVEWERDRILTFIFDLAQERSSLLFREGLARTILFGNLDDDDGKAIDRIEYLLGRPLIEDEKDDCMLNECTHLYFAGTITVDSVNPKTGETEEGTPAPLMDTVPLMEFFLARGTANKAFLRLMARTLVDWDDEISDPFAALIAKIPD